MVLVVTMNNLSKWINRILGKFNLQLERVDTLKSQGRLGTLLDLRNRGFGPKQVLDIGASNGCWTRECRMIYPSATYFMVDPLEENRYALEKLSEQSDGKVNFIIAAAGSSAGSMMLNVQEDLVGSSFLKDADPRFKGTPREVQVISVDDLVHDNKIKKPDLLKLDVQGFELNVLEGSLTIFGHTEVIILETSFFEFCEGIELFYEVIDYMNSKEYIFYDILTIMRRPYDGALAQIDAVFVKKDSNLRASNLWYPLNKT